MADVKNKIDAARKLDNDEVLRQARALFNQKSTDEEQHKLCYGLYTLLIERKCVNQPELLFERACQCELMGQYKTALDDIHQSGKLLMNNTEKFPELTPHVVFALGRLLYLLKLYPVSTFILTELRTEHPEFKASADCILSAIGQK